MNTYLAIIDEKLIPVYKYILYFCGLQNDNVPTFFRKPTKFIGLITLLLIAFYILMDYFVCQLFGIVYPALCTFFYIQNCHNYQHSDSNIGNNLMKYWVLFGTLYFLEIPFMWLLNYFAIYYHIKFMVILFFVKNNFVRVNLVYPFIANYLTILVNKYKFLGQLVTNIDNLNTQNLISEGISILNQINQVQTQSNHSHTNHSHTDEQNNLPDGYTTITSCTTDTEPLYKNINSKSTVSTIVTNTVTTINTPLSDIQNVD